MYEGYEMSDRHRQIIAKNRVYLLHNMHPTELLWSSLISKEVLSMEMVDEIKCGTTTSEKLGQLLDMLPTRGPEAFDDFIEVLLECDHSHVAEYLKTKEATEKFRSEIDPHCNQVSDNLTEKFVKIFKKNTPAVQRFAERKFDLIMEEQTKDIVKKEEELRALENKNMMLQLEVTQLRGLISNCYEASETIRTEIKREFISKSSLREESKHIDNLKTKLKDVPGLEDMYKFFENIQEFLSFLEKYTDVKSRDRQKDEKVRVISTRGKSLQDKLQVLTNMIIQVGDELGQKVNVPGIRVRSEMEKIHQRFKDVCADVMNVRDVFRNTMRQKRKLEAEVLAMLHNFQEIRRLDTECREKQAHVNDLHKEAHMVKKKIVANSRQSRKLSEQIQRNLEKKKNQLKEVEHDLYTNIHSADKRLHALLNLLPDLEDGNNNEFLRSDTEMTSEIGSQTGSRLGTPSIGSIRPNSAILENHTYRKLAQTMGNHDRDHVSNNQNDYHENNDNNHDHEAMEGLHGSKINIAETENRAKSPQKQSRKQFPDNKYGNRNNVQSNFSGHNRNTLHREKSEIAKKSETPRKPESLSKEDIDKWLVEQQSNEHLKTLHKRTVNRSVSLDLKEHISAGNHQDSDPRMDTIQESARESSRSHVSRSISMKEVKSDTRQLLNQNTDIDKEKCWFETKTHSSSSGNSSGNSPEFISREETIYVPKTPGSRTYRRDDLRSSRGDITRSSQEKFVSFSTEKFPLERRRQSQQLQQPPLMTRTDQNANVAIETETTELATSSRAARKSYTSMKKERELEQKAKSTSGRETLSTKRIDIML